MLTVKDIKDAEKRIGEYAYRTPLIKSEYMSELAGSDFYLKLENLQPTNSFKIRGAANKLVSLSSDPSIKERGVITASAGNHGQAVALCASALGINSEVIVPKNTPKVKINKIKEYGARLLLYGSNYDHAEQYGIALAHRKGLPFISPYNDELVIAGQGTAGLEIMLQQPQIGALLVPVGGGGLIAGVSLVARAINPDVKIVGVQSVASPAMYEAIRANRIIETKIGESIAEGIAGNIEPGSITFDYVKKFVDDIVLVKEASIRKAIRLLWEKEGQISEGAGAVPIAAAIENRKILSNCRKVAAIITGGNIDSELLKGILR